VVNTTNSIATFNARASLTECHVHIPLSRTVLPSANTDIWSRPVLPCLRTPLFHFGFGMRLFLRHVISSTVCPLRFSTRTRPCSVYFMFSPIIPLLGFLGVLAGLVSASIMLTSWSSVPRCVFSLAIALSIRAMSVLIAPRVGSISLVMFFSTS